MIKILSYEPMQKGCKIGVANVVVEKMQMFFLVSIFEKNGKRWASFQQTPKSPKEDNGETKWIPTCGFMSKDLDFKFSDEVIKALDAQAA